MLVLVTASPVFVGKNNFVKAIRAIHPEISTVIQNINADNTSMVLGEKEHILYGKGYIEDVLCGLRFRISAKSFYQVNPVQTQKLYEKALSLAKLSKNMTVVDAYSGVGTIGLIAAKDVKKVISVELNKDATKDAISNAKLNSIKNVDFYNADAGDFLREMAASEAEVDVLIMDPPRTGSTPVFIDSVLKLSPQKVIYISCNPETLERDLRQFVKGGYEAVKIVPFDCFAMTSHVETIVLLSKLDSKKYISVELPMDDMDLTSAESKATYKQIQNYVLEKFGFKVSTLYIAQVKRKYGLDIREHYNISNNESRKIPQCPFEKEEAIFDALKYFKMI